MAREADLTQEERDAAALGRHRKRQRLGYDPPSSPVKMEHQDAEEVPRSTAAQARHIIGDLYGPFGFLNSQVGEATFVDHFIDGAIVAAPKSESQLEELGEAADHYGESDNDSDHELVVQVARLKNRLKIALRERDDLQDQCTQFQQSYHQADAERSQLRDELQRWEHAATAASSLTKMMRPYCSQNVVE
ncbi:hypothetical protein B0H12DRAFT_1238909 [Mycena haematopus]|nr:hypothetical protein B0H12DRAFT_1238909 [Mycena haematopus]